MKATDFAAAISRTETACFYPSQLCNSHSTGSSSSIELGFPPALDGSGMPRAFAFAIAVFQRSPHRKTPTSSISLGERCGTAAPRRSIKSRSCAFCPLKRARTLARRAPWPYLAHRRRAGRGCAARRAAPRPGLSGAIVARDLSAGREVGICGGVPGWRVGVGGADLARAQCWRSIPSDPRD